MIALTCDPGRGWPDRPQIIGRGRISLPRSRASTKLLCATSKTLALDLINSDVQARNAAANHAAANHAAVQSVWLLQVNAGRFMPAPRNAPKIHRHRRDVGCKQQPGDAA